MYFANFPIFSTDISDTRAIIIEREFFLQHIENDFFACLLIAFFDLCFFNKLLNRSYFSQTILPFTPHPHLMYNYRV